MPKSKKVLDQHYYAEVYESDLIAKIQRQIQAEMSKFVEEMIAEEAQRSEALEMQETQTKRKKNIQR